MNKKKVLIIGGGFGGLQAAKSLGDKKDLDVTLLDRRNYHLFQPLLYQVAMAGLSPAEIAVPIRTILSKYKNVEVLMANVESVDVQNKKVHSDMGDHEYDYLIMACGAKHSYFGKEQWENFAPGLKTLEQATEIRRRILMSFESAEKEKDLSKKKELLTFVVVGGGPTGVELAGAIGELTRFTLSKDFKNIRPNLSRIILIEAGERILTGFSESLSESAVRELENLGVQVWTHSRVTDLNEEGVQVGKEFVNARTVVWAAGVQPSSLNPTLQVPLDVQKRVIVEEDLSLSGHPEVFVIGDQAHAKDKTGKALPGLAPVAIQQGRYVGKMIVNDLKGKPREPFAYIDKGQMATIGRKKAILEVGSLKMTGFWAWMSWLFVHLYYLIGFKNRTFVLFQWAWQYLTYSRGARLIIHKDWKSFK